MNADDLDSNASATSEVRVVLRVLLGFLPIRETDRSCGQAEHLAAEDNGLSAHPQRDSRRAGLLLGNQWIRDAAKDLAE